MADKASKGDAHTRRNARWLIVGVAVAVICIGALVWRYTPLAELADPDRIAKWMEGIRSSAWAPIIVVGAFVIGGLIMFPLTLLITATAIVFDPVMAIAVSLTGSIANASTLYWIGHRIMRDTMNNAFGEYVDKLRRALDRSGIIAVATIRMMPVAPFTLVNLAAGAIDVRFRDYVLGTLLGILPGTIALTAFGHQLRAIMEHPTLKNVGLLVAAIAGWIVLSLGLQRMISKRRTASG